MVLVSFDISSNKHQTVSLTTFFVLFCSIFVLFSSRILHGLYTFVFRPWLALQPLSLHRSYVPAASPCQGWSAAVVPDTETHHPVLQPPSPLATLVAKTQSSCGLLCISAAPATSVHEHRRHRGRDTIVATREGKKNASAFAASLPNREILLQRQPPFKTVGFVAEFVPPFVMTSDSKVLLTFARQPVSPEMVNYLVATTNSIIQVKPQSRKYGLTSTDDLLVVPSMKTVSLHHFIRRLIKYLNVQTPTLMATCVYLTKVRNLLPANAVGMETTRHRIFLAALILSAKSLNDSSPLNKHWTKYTDGLLSNDEVNMAERELLGLLKWDINIKQHELEVALEPFLHTIRTTLAARLDEVSAQKVNYYRLSNTISSRSSSTSSIASNASSLSLSDGPASNYSLQSLMQEEADNKAYTYRPPLAAKSANTLNVPSRKEVNLIHSGRIVDGLASPCR